MYYFTAKRRGKAIRMQMSEEVAITNGSPQAGLELFLKYNPDITEAKLENDNNNQKKAINTECRNSE